MGWFKRKKEVEAVPKLPELPELPGASQPALLPRSEVPDVPLGLPKIEMHTLPILPDSEVGRQFNQEAIKQAVSQPQQPIRPLPEPPKLKPIPAMPIKKEPERKRTLEMPTIIPKQIQRPTKKIEPVFVRLDKFQATIETFEELKNKIIEIEELLGKTREIKVREEQELAEWEREIQIIKSRIDLIDKNIFKDLD